MMSRKAIMTNAHKLAKMLVDETGDYAIALQIAMKEIWRQVKLYDKKRFTQYALDSAWLRLTTLKEEKNANVHGIPNWIIRKNLSNEEAQTVISEQEMYGIVHETAKAILIKFNTEFGKVEMWTPKSVLVA